MPTMTNPETGETKEISMEEFLKMMRSGNGSIQQVVTHADGSTSSTTIFGNISSDGLDRSVNIFVDSDTFNAFITRKLKKMTGQMPDPESEKAPLELFEMTIDFTHAAIMGIVRKTKEELSVKLYTRNEQKATFDYLLQSSKTWKVNENGSITFNVADLQGEDKTISLYMLSFLEMRQFLRASGKLAELKELGNRGTGVIIKATGQADDATATIVRGLNRPNLPCEMFLLGEQMMRPYPDELFSDAMASTMSLDERIKAAENGDPDMMELLAQQYLNGDEVEQDFVKSAYWWQKLADTGNAVGQFNIGLHYAKGCGVTRDFQKAAEWMRLSAENGDEDAPDAAENYSQAYSNLQKANTGDAAAQAAIAKLYMQIGGSLEQYGHQNDYAESFKWAQKAAAQGNLDGMYCLALCYEHGRGTAVSKINAADTYKKASEQGHAPSQWNLAVCYMNGYGYERNEVTGYMWAYRAADQDYDLAVDGLRYQDKLLEQLIEHYEDPEAVETLEGTQYEGRAARCESLKAGTSLTPKITKDKNGGEAIELFYNGGSVGLLSRWNTAPLLALLKLERIDLKVTVKSCIPKSKRGPRARNADVKLQLAVKERQSETPEERAIRLEEERKQEELRREQENERIRQEEYRKKEEEERIRQEELRRKEEEELRRIEEEKLQAEQERLEAERRIREDEERLAAQKAAEEKRLEEEKEAAELAEQMRIKKEEVRKKQSKILKILLIILVLLAALAIAAKLVILPAIENARDYKAAQELMEAGHFDEAHAAFLNMGEYKDAPTQACEAMYRKAESMLAKGQFETAIEMWKDLDTYSDSSDRAQQALFQWRDPDYQSAITMMQNGDYLAASELFTSLNGYLDSEAKSEECISLKLEADYQSASRAVEEGNYSGAMELYLALGDYRDSASLYTSTAYIYGCILIDEKNYDQAIQVLELTDGYDDSADKIQEATYAWGTQFLESGQYLASIEQYEKCENYLDAKMRILDAKFAYAKDNLNRNDTNTSQYLDELIAAKYPGAEKLRDELYAWKVEILGFNNSPYTTEGQSTVSKYSAMYAHFRVVGGKPGESTNVKAVLHAPNGQSGTIPFYNCTDGSTFYVNFWYDNPYYSASGTMTLCVYSESGKLLAKDSVSVVG